LPSPTAARLQSIGPAKRWDMDADGQPFEGGGPHNICHETIERNAAPGVWRCADPLWCGPRYYRKINRKGQMELFS
jgi:hypothetical protein